MKTNKQLLSVLIAVMAISLIVASCAQPAPAPASPTPTSTSPPSTSASPTPTAVSPTPSKSASPTPTAVSPTPSKSASPTPTPASPTSQTLTLTLGAPTPNMAFYGVLAEMSNLLSKSIPNLKVTPSAATGGNTAHFTRLSQGETQLCSADPITSINAFAGVGAAFKGTPLTNIRTVLALRPTLYVFVVTQDSGITKVEELNGRKFSPGPAGTALLAESTAILDALGVKPNLQILSTADATDYLKDRRIDGLVQYSVADISEIITTLPIRVLTLTDQQIATARQKVPIYPWFDIKAGHFTPDQPAMKSFGMLNTLYARADVPEDIVYQIAKVITEKYDRLVVIMPADLKGVDPVKLTMEGLSPGMAPFHPGVVRFLREKGYEVPKEYLPPEMK